MRAALGLGSNLGDRRAHLEGALAGLAERVEILAVSRFLETEPVGGPPQGAYLNAAVALATELSPGDLLGLAGELERRAGRVRGERWGPRTLDVDLLLYGELTLKEPGLVVPHPRLASRAFVLVPLAEVAGSWRVPGTGKTVEGLRADLPVHS